MWIAEHHFNDYGLCPAPPVLASFLAARTRTLRLGMGVSLLPLHHPVDLAEQLAVLDVVSGGRLDVGIGRGGTLQDYQTFQSDRGDSRARVEEGIALIQECWSGRPFDFKGRFHSAERLHVRPRPAQRPHPPLYVASNSEDSVRSAARLGLPTLSSYFVPWPMSWEPEVEELKRRRELGRRMGGPENVERQHKAGRLTVRERIGELLDAGSLAETGSLAGKATYADGKIESFLPANSVLGTGRIDGRRVVVCGDDFTVRGGAADAAIHAKQVYGERMARELRLPIVRLVDGTGGGGSVKTYEQTGRTYVPGNPGWDLIVAMLSEVPVVAAALGPVAGLGAARVAHSHFSLMVRGVSQVFVAGPPAAQRAFGSPVGKEELGGVDIHGVNGTVDNVVDSETEAFEQVRRFLGYLPANVWQLPPRATPTDDPKRRDEALLSFIPKNRRRGYDPRKLIGHVVDRDSFFELGRTWGGSLVTASRASRRLPGGSGRIRPDEIGRRADRRRLGQAHALRRSV